jgi:hypothetical protein
MMVITSQGTSQYITNRTEEQSFLLTGRSPKVFSRPGTRSIGEIPVENICELDPVQIGPNNPLVNMLEQHVTFGTRVFADLI